MKIADPILLSLFMRDNEKCNISHAPSGIQFPILNVLESLIPKDQKKYNNTEMKSGRLFTAATQHLTLAVVNIKSNQRKINRLKAKVFNQTIYYYFHISRDSRLPEVADCIQDILDRCRGTTEKEQTLQRLIDKVKVINTVDYFCRHIRGIFMIFILSSAQQ